ncbi:MAG: aminoglycoside phosphotransferase (APT) family kinase protein [Myxococcota bacterium]|jgi:aminoglycoside phosphotransferase (APT) family kinase protein
MSPPIDQATAVRDGETLDLDSLRAWFAASVPDLAGKPVTLAQFPKGHSNLTYLLNVGGQALVLRRPPFGTRAKSAHDMGREFRILSALQGHYLLAPEAIAFCEDESVLGAPFYLMQRLEGLIVRKRLPEGVPGDPDAMGEMSRAFVDNMVAIHAVDWQAAGLSDLYRGEGYVARQISGWTRRYDKAQTDEIATVNQVATWLAENLPVEAVPTLIHNDYKHDNLVLDPADPTRIIGVLDWEMATVGDPLMDLGTTLGYWIETNDPAQVQAFAFCPSNRPGMYSRQQLVDAYQQTSGREVATPVFYFVYGLFKLAVVAQQIYQRFKLGHSKDPRFASFIFGVRMLTDLAARAIDKGRINNLG